MKSKIKVVFDMSFNDSDGKCKASVSFELVDHPEIPCPEKVKELVIGEIKMLCSVMGAAGKQLFWDNPSSKNHEDLWSAKSALERHYPRTKRRVMMPHVDAGPGNPNWARFVCKCGYETECGNVSESELRRGRPCPKCNV